MRADLIDLKISERELEQLSGCDVGPVFIGGPLSGVCRRSVVQHPRRFLTVCFTELVMFCLFVMVAMPLGLLTLRNTTASITQGRELMQFLAVTMGLAGGGLLVWNGLVWMRGKHFQGLMHLLDEVDRFHAVLGAIAILDELETASLSKITGVQDRAAVLEALRMTRDTLVAGLMTEKILREQHGFLARRQQLSACIETNLATLQALEINHLGNNYEEFLNDALQIGLSVRQEIKKLTP